VLPRVSPPPPLAGRKWNEWLETLINNARDGTFNALLSSFPGELCEVEAHAELSELGFEREEKKRKENPVVTLFLVSDYYLLCLQVNYMICLLYEKLLQRVHFKIKRIKISIHVPVYN